MNKLTKTEITELDTEIKQLTIITANFLDHHNNNVDKHNYILETINKYTIILWYFNRQLKKTNQLFAD